MNSSFTVRDIKSNYWLGRDSHRDKGDLGNKFALAPQYLQNLGYEPVLCCSLVYGIKKLIVYEVMLS